MKLTNYHRQAFVKAVMDDVPKMDYQAQWEAVVLADMIATAPPEVAACLKNEALRPYVIHPYHSHHPHLKDVGNGGMQTMRVYLDFKPSKKCVAAEKPIIMAATAQCAARAALEAKLTGAIATCTTLKVALEHLPEFAKYLPAEETKSNFLPAIANLAADLAKAGWPKGKELEAA